MMELLSPAGAPEAVIAAVQNGADAVYLGLGDFNARRGAHNFTPEEFEKAVRYCHLRNCRVYVTMNTLVNDREMTAALAAAKLASDKGADAILVQDLGLARVIHEALPDIPLHASTQMSIHNLAGAEAAAQMGITRVVLARELNLEEIRFISQHASVETEVFVHGALCFCHSGQCYLSAMIGRRSGNRGMCAQPCRMQYSLGGRMDDYPLSLKDNCLVDRLQELEEAGVSCVKIEGRMKRPEYTGIVTGVYSKVLKEKRKPTEDEMALLERVFSRQGFTQGYLNGDKADMHGVRAEADEDLDRLYADARRAYSDGEIRRVPIHFYSLVEKGCLLALECDILLRVQIAVENDDVVVAPEPSDIAVFLRVVCDRGEALILAPYGFRQPLDLLGQLDILVRCNRQCVRIDEYGSLVHDSAACSNKEVLSRVVCQAVRVIYRERGRDLDDIPCA